MELFDVYPLFDINIVKGRGCSVWDDKGQEYLDLYGGHAVISIGHCHPHYVEKMTEQLNALGFYSNSVINMLQRRVAERLGKACGYEDYQLFLINSGAEANENALKLASFKTGRTRVLSAAKAFHGRTSLAVEATDNAKIIAPINANGHVTYLPLNDLAGMGGGAEQGRRMRLHHRVHTGSGRHKAGHGRVCAGPARGLQAARRGAGVRRDTVRLRPLGPVLRPPVARHQARPYHRCEGNRQRIPHGSRAHLARLQARIRPTGHHLRRQPHGVRSRAGRARRDGGRAAGGQRARDRRLSHGAAEGIAGGREAHRRRARPRTHDWHRPRHAAQGAAQPPRLRRALLHGLRLDQHPAPAAAAYVHQGDGRRLHPAAQASVRGCQVTMVRMFAHA